MSISLLKQVIPWVRLTNVCGEWAPRLVIKAIRKVKVVVALLVCCKFRVVFQRCDINRCATLPAPDETCTQQLTALLTRQFGEVKWIVVQDLVELGYELLQLTVPEQRQVRMMKS